MKYKNWEVFMQNFFIGIIFISLIIPFFFQTNYLVNLLCRFIAGFNQVYFTTYPPVLCDQYGPKKYKTIMISIVQSGTVFGIMLGYANK